MSPASLSPARSQPPFAPDTGAPTGPSPRSGAMRWADACVALAGVVLAALWLWRLLPIGGSELRDSVSARALLPAALVLGVVIALVSMGAGVPHAARRGWRRIAFAFAAWWIAGVIWEASGRPALSLADPVQILFFPLVLWGVFCFPNARSDRSARLRFWLDTGVVVLSGAAGAWYFVFWPTITNTSIDRAAVFVNALYPIGDLVLLFAACAVLLRRPDVTSRRALQWVAVGLIARFLGDLEYGWVTMQGSYHAGGLADLIWLSSAWALAFGAREQLRSSHLSAVDDRRTPIEERGYSLLPYVSVGIVYTFLLATARSSWDGRVGGVLVSAVGVTFLILVRQFLATRENVHLERESLARDSEARFRSLVQHSTDVICVVDVDGVVQYVSPSITRQLGYEPDEVLGVPLVSLLHEDDRDRAAAGLATSVKTRGTTKPILLRVRCADGSWRHVESLSTNLLDEPTVNGLVVTARDVTERAALEAQLLHQAFHDPLTGLANRALFRDRVNHALAREGRRHDGMAVLFLDLDDFKTVNDSLGHAAGDRLLITVAERLLNATRGCDTAARLGGDEFAVLLENARTDQDAIIVAERIVRALRMPMPIDGTEVSVGASIGIARSRVDESADDLLRNADVAMYRAKHRGTGGHEIFAPEMHTALIDRMELEADLRRAIASPGLEEFRVLYQPVIDLETGVASGVEALVRWSHPRRGLVMPLTFVPVAESTGLIVQLGSWVLREACREAAGWQNARKAAALAAGTVARPFSMSVNLSGRQLQHPGIADEVAGALRESGLDPSCLVLEITESVIMQDTDANLQALHALKALGVRLAIDDFGTGYSSLSYLQRFPIDILKIDKSFVDGVGRGGSDAALTRTIVALGEMLALHCVAEGVEDDAQRQHLQAIGCKYAQGFLFARPLPAEAARDVMRGGVDAPGALKTIAALNASVAGLASA